MYDLPERNEWLEPDEQEVVDFCSECNKDIYAGEDLPEQEEVKEPPKFASQETVKELEALILSLDEETSKKYLSAILEKYEIYSLNELSQKIAENLIERLKGKETNTA